MLRSSALFWFRQGKGFKTTISFLNYWELKRGLKVAVVASTRDMSGKLVRRERLRFEKGQVVNLVPGGAESEGSVEIEVFSSENMVVPYAAVMAVYETPRGVSMVHSYTRAYSQHEIEERRTIPRGEESCWTLRDGAGVRSFGVFHNGGHAQPAQAAALVVRNVRGESREASVAVPALAPYATVKVRPAEWIPGLEGFLGGKPGNAALSFTVQDAFTRMLVGNETADDCQVTHSNFNYSRHKTDSVPGQDEVAHMHVPSLGGRPREVIVYPDADPGRYEIDLAGTKTAFSTGTPLALRVPAGHQRLDFRKEGGSLPTRIVTALVLEAAKPGVLPAECSLGVVHRLRPPKRLWWSLCAAGPELRSSLIAHEYSTVYGRAPAGATIGVRLYSAAGKGVLEKSLPISELERLEDGLPVSAVFPEAEAFLGGGFGWFTLYSEYPGFKVFSTLEKATGSFTLEHGF